MATTLVTGDITLPDNAPDFSNATIYINLEANAPMGMSPEIAAQTTIQNVTYSGNPIPFTLTGEDVGTGGKYNLRVHISMDGSEDFNKGDYITKHTYTVLKAGAPDALDVAVQAV